LSMTTASSRHMAVAAAAPAKLFQKKQSRAARQMRAHSRESTQADTRVTWEYVDIHVHVLTPLLLFEKKS